MLAAEFNVVNQVCGLPIVAVREEERFVLDGTFIVVAVDGLVDGRKGTVLGDVREWTCRCEVEVPELCSLRLDVS